MKTSNKLLLGIFLTIILLATTVQLMVYAKYKRGEYVKFEREEISPMNSLEIPAVRFISIKGLGNFDVLPGDKPKLEIQKGKTGGISYRVVNDTLVIIGDTSHTIDDLQRGMRNFSHVNVYLPATTQITATYSNLRVNGAVDTVNAPSYSVRLERNSRLNIYNRNHDAAVYFNQLNISSEQSEIELGESSLIKEVNVQLISSKIDDKESEIKKLTVEADSKSTVTLSGKNIKALK
jgi:hypothetical protein